MIDLELLKIPFQSNLIYNDVYRHYHRVKYLTDIQTEFGTLGIMISKKKTFFIIHIFVDGFYLKYPKRASYYSELNKYIKHASTRWYKRYIIKLLKHGSERMMPFEFYHAMDRVIFSSSIGKRNTKRILTQYILDKDNDKKFCFYDCINTIVGKHTKIVDTIEPLINNTARWIMDFPYRHDYIPKLNLQEFVIKPTKYGYVKRIPFTEFCKMIEDWTDDEIVELIGRYRPLNLDEYKKDKRRILFKIVQGRIYDF